MISEEACSIASAGSTMTPDVHGILVQLPLPPHIAPRRVLETISVAKDVDGFHLYNVGGLVIGQTVFPPCTPYGVQKILEHEGIELEGKNVTVVGASNIVGKPLALMLMQREATVAICHAKTRDLAQYTILADILVVAAGQAEPDRGADGAHGRRGDRCRDQFPSRRQAGRRCRFRGREGKGLLHHAGSRRRRAHDGHHAAGKHRRRRRTRQRARIPAEPAADRRAVKSDCVKRADSPLRCVKMRIRLRVIAVRLVRLPFAAVLLLGVRRRFRAAPAADRGAPRCRPNRSRHAARGRCRKPLQRSGTGQDQPGDGGRAVARLCAEREIGRCLCHRSRDIFEVVDHYNVGGNPQHIIPSWDLKTLWVAGSAERKLPRHPDAHRSQDRQAGNDHQCAGRL